MVIINADCVSGLLTVKDNDTMGGGGGGGGWGDYDYDDI